MDAITALLTRNSNPHLQEPAPSQEALEQIYQAALRAPDHVNLKPWRFLTVQGEARVALGEMMHDAALVDNPQLEESKKTKLRNAPLRAPLVIIVAVKLVEHAKVPEIEQWLSAGAAATNMLNAAHALGYAGIWRSGDMAFSSTLMRSIGLHENERIVGFVYLGTPVVDPKPLKTLDSQLFFEEWGA